jgi:hypothetical protein
MRIVSSSASVRLIRRSSLAVASAMVRLPRSIARRKMLSEWPCEVDAPPPFRAGRQKGVYDVGIRKTTVAADHTDEMRIPNMLAVALLLVSPQRRRRSQGQG